MIVLPIDMSLETSNCISLEDGRNFDEIFAASGEVASVK